MKIFFLENTNNINKKIKTGSFMSGSSLKDYFYKIDGTTKGFFILKNNGNNNIIFPKIKNESGVFFKKDEIIDFINSLGIKIDSLEIESFPDIIIKVIEKQNIENQEDKINFKKN